MKTKYISMILFLFLYGNTFGQWINFEDETDARIIVTNVSDNTDPDAVDDQEKDLVIGDFNNDSFIDLVVVRKVLFSNPGTKTDLLFMNRNGVLEDQTDIYAPEFLTNGTDSRDVITVDVNNDNWLDLFIISTFSDQPRLYINQGEDSNGDWLGFEDESSSRLPTITVNPIQFCAGWSGDLTGNLSPDIYMVNYASTGEALDVLLINDGAGNYTEETESRMGDLRRSSFGTGVEFHDIDNDNDLDIVKNLGLDDIDPFDAKGTIALFNNGDGTFDNFYVFPTNESYMMTAGDLDDNWLMDFYIVDDAADYVHSITGFLVDESLTITQTNLATTRTDEFGGNVKMVDLDGDGDLDVGMSSVDTDIPPCETGPNRRFIIFENEGEFGGTLIHPYGDTMNEWNISTYDHDYIDINNDGFMDIILGTCDGYKIFMQENTSLSVDTLAIADIGIFPNPSNGILTVTLDALKTTNLKVQLYAMDGKLLRIITNDKIVSNQLSIDLRKEVTSGMYLLKFTTDTGISTKKIIIE